VNEWRSHNSSLLSSAGFLNRGSARDRDWKKRSKRLFLNLAKLKRSTEKYNSLLKRALTIIIGLLYLQLTDHANVPWAVYIIFLCRGSLRPENYFNGSSRVKALRKAGLRFISHTRVGSIPSIKWLTLLCLFSLLLAAVTIEHGITYLIARPTT
jgi:hypothetical protein